MCSTAMRARGVACLAAGMFLTVAASGQHTKAQATKPQAAPVFPAFEIFKRMRLTLSEGKHDFKVIVRNGQVLQMNQRPVDNSPTKVVHLNIGTVLFVRFDPIERDP